MHNLLNNIPLLTMLCIVVVLLMAIIIRRIFKWRSTISHYLDYILIFFLLLVIGDLWSFYVASWGWGILSFMILREYFSLVDLRPQDRLGVLGAYLSIPFMMHYIHKDVYNMFIITIPVYSFLLIPFLISINRKRPKGAIYSIGTIDFGLFLFVYCLGHLAYLSFYSTWMAGMVVLNIIICDSVAYIVNRKINIRWRRMVLKYLIAAPLTILLSVLLSEWTGIPLNHSIILGSMIPALVIIGNHTIIYFERDLGIMQENIRPGRGLIIDNVKSILYAAPVVFHYIRYFLIE